MSHCREIKEEMQCCFACYWNWGLQCEFMSNGDMALEPSLPPAESHKAQFVFVTATSNKQPVPPPPPFSVSMQPLVFIQNHLMLICFFNFHDSAFPSNFSLPLCPCLSTNDRENIEREKRVLGDRIISSLIS